MSGSGNKDGQAITKSSRVYRMMGWQEYWLERWGWATCWRNHGKKLRHSNSASSFQRRTGSFRAHQKWKSKWAYESRIKVAAAAWASILGISMMSSQATRSPLSLALNCNQSSQGTFSSDMHYFAFHKKAWLFVVLHHLFLPWTCVHELFHGKPTFLSMPIWITHPLLWTGQKATIKQTSLFFREGFLRCRTT